MASALVLGDIKYASIAVEHGARLQGVMLQIEAREDYAGIDLAAQAAIRKAQTTGQPE
jgi:cytoskeletal protein CcmA (bactofilin family)